MSGSTGAAVVALGGALGSLARYALAGTLERAGATGFPWATLLANVSGCLLIGLVAAAFGPGARWPEAEGWRLFLATGACGGYTTFSAFGLQTLELAQAGQPLRATLNVLVSVTLCLLATWAGLAAGAALLQPPPG